MLNETCFNACTLLSALGTDLQERLNGAAEHQNITCKSGHAWPLQKVLQSDAAGMDCLCSHMCVQSHSALGQIAQRQLPGCKRVMQHHMLCC